jgi:hypothetical protein
MQEGFQDPDIQTVAAEIAGNDTAENGSPNHPREVLDNIKRATIVALVRLGGSRRMAAREVGCNPATITRTAGRDPHFAERLAHAESLADRKALENISRAQDQEKYWRAAAWVLERRNPEEFARRTPHTFTAEQVMEVIARLIRVLLPAVPDARRDEVMLEFNDTLAELAPLIAKASPDGRPAITAPNGGGSSNPYAADEENLSVSQVEEIRRKHWERSESWIRGLSDIDTHDAWTMAIRRLSVERNGDLRSADPGRIGCKENGSSVATMRRSAIPEAFRCPVLCRLRKGWPSSTRDKRSFGPKRRVLRNTPPHRVDSKSHAICRRNSFPHNELRRQGPARNTAEKCEGVARCARI